ncbi:MAG: YggS family pyridoxal phosphate-dependent enzyme [Alistipes sp.]|jgi:pyridoxal phosphate enzyme (YggS family)|nr:YggS family pyridoxal phosphate-dependent enzyme [Alistipes sp.]
MSIAENIKQLRDGLPEGVTLVAVSKTHPPEAVVEAWEAGQRDFGENRPQEMVAKRAALAALPEPLDGIRWHQIGHLQSNKVRLIAPFVEMIHSVDSARLAREISRQAVLCGRVIDVLLEIRVAREESKSGWVWSELVEWLSGGEWLGLEGIRIRGVMGIATFTDDLEVVRGEFLQLAGWFSELRVGVFGSQFDTLSMGMSGDFPLAVECGATLVRVGSAIFGFRN